MPKLPDTTVAKFDSPLRRTTRSAEITTIAEVAATPPPPVAPVAEPPTTEADDLYNSRETRETPVIALPRPRSETPVDTAEQNNLGKRITVRIDDDINRALELERLDRRLAGDNATIADVARKALGTWAKRRLARDRS
jgi:hypothetical protein